MVHGVKRGFGAIPRVMRAFPRSRKSLPRRSAPSAVSSNRACSRTRGRTRGGHGKVGTGGEPNARGAYVVRGPPQRAAAAAAAAR